MKKYYFSIFVIFLALTSCMNGDPENAPLAPKLRVLKDYEKDLANSSSNFAIDLYLQLKKSGNPNLFFSPFSIQQALSMTMNGNKGEVLEEYKELLGFENTSLEEANNANHELTQFLKEVDSKVTLNIANGIWYREGLSVKAAFQQTMQKQYLAALSTLDMKDPNSAEIINQWIEKNTNNLIKDMIDQVRPDAVMYLVNAIYFYGDWKYQFDQNLTSKAPFHTSPSESHQVDMMSLSDPADINYFKSDNLTYLEIPYSTGQYSMGIILPDGPNLAAIENELSLSQIDHWKENLHPSAAIIKMPKFKMRQKINNLRDDLEAMGLVTPFYFDNRNFTELFDSHTDPLKISRVIHDALIDVDEKGTEAAAATVVEIELTAANPTPLIISMDRPFIFFIQEKHSGAILFMGKLSDPSIL
ncbi:serpin family protein [Echinicola marina]|uniref:serpin family protein n=1 Tax=Echinicola marina TaxID=2859768 RepID=UPI001CF6E36A|nr:serpin family protein [Echinicola marina]UCS95585.1 serpin family protein [Echinicola marina]